MSSLGFSETQWILEFNPTEIGAYFLKLKHVISEKLYFAVLLEEWRAVLGNIAEDPRIMI